MPGFRPDKNFALELDEKDPIAGFRDQFEISKSDLVYMDGNSLGRLPKGVLEKANHLISTEWGQDLIKSWNTGWWDSPIRVGEKIAGLIGASPDQVIVCDSVSINLFKLTMAALNMDPSRKKVITDTLNFPSDLYVLQGCVQLAGGDTKLIMIGSRDGDITPDLDQLYDSIDHSTAVVSLSHVVFKSGYLYDMKAITEKAHQMGALVIWDLCHSVGSVPINLDNCDVDLALGCTYKYLNGGPGSPAFIYINKRLQSSLISPIWGWWGQESPFEFGLKYYPAPGINRFLTGSQPIFSMLCLEAALDPLIQAGMISIREKSELLTEYFIYLFDQILAPLGFMLGTPRQISSRGSHVSLRHSEGYRINRVLIEELNLIPDFRDPDNIRYGLAPIYTTYSEVWEAVNRTRQVVVNSMYQKLSKVRMTVT